MNDLKRKINTFLRNPSSLGAKILYKISPFLPDALYLKLLFPLKTGYRLNLRNPRTYNEKLQWLKLHYREPIQTQLVDKYEVKKYTKEMIGEEYVVKTYGVWNSFEEIDFDTLPNQFVLKTTHDQGGVVICKDKAHFDYQSAKKKLAKHLKIKHYYLTREWPYKNVKPRIMAEKLLLEDTKEEIKDYKFYCFNGEPKIVFIASNRNKGNKVIFDFYDINFNHLNIKRPNSRNDFKRTSKPKNYDKMIELSSKLSHGFPHVRVDFYNIKGEIYLGEMTFFTGGGMKPFIPDLWDYKFGKWIDLGKIKTSNIK